MEQTDKPLPIEQFLDDKSSLDPDDLYRVNDERESLLPDAQPKCHKNQRGGRKNPDRYLNSGGHTLPSDGFDSDYAVAGLQYEWLDLSPWKSALVEGRIINAACTYSFPFKVSGQRLEDMCKVATKSLYDWRSTIVALALVVATAMATATEHSESPPLRLSETGLYVDGSVTEVRAGVLPYLPQYTLWSDGTTKRRWLYLPPGTFIDGSDPDRWVFPPGTRLWKEFSYTERRIETRFIERLADGTWQFATYGWDEDEGDAVLARSEHATQLNVAEAPNGIYILPSEDDCRACHESGDVPALGVSALQLSPDRDPQAAHGMGSYPSGDELDLFGLVERGWLQHLPPELLIRPPRIFARSPTERAALGYLHINCGNCHNDSAQRAPVKLRLAQSVADAAGSHSQTLDSTVHQYSRYRPPRTSGKAYTIVPGDPDASVLALRLRSRNPRMQMPPLGTRVTDAEGVALIERWITNDLFQSRESLP